MLLAEFTLLFGNKLRCALRTSDLLGGGRPAFCGLRNCRPPIVSTLYGCGDRFDMDGCGQHISNAVLLIRRTDTIEDDCGCRACVFECLRRRVDDDEALVGNCNADIVDVESFRIGVFFWIKYILLVVSLG